MTLNEIIGVALIQQDWMRVALNLLRNVQAPRTGPDTRDMLLRQQERVSEDLSPHLSHRDEQHGCPHAETPVLGRNGCLRLKVPTREGPRHREAEEIGGAKGTCALACLLGDGEDSSLKGTSWQSPLGRGCSGTPLTASPGNNSRPGDRQPQ